MSSDVQGGPDALGQRYGLGRYESTHVDTGRHSARRYARGMVVTTSVLLPLVVLPGVLSSAGIEFSVVMGLLVACLDVVGILGLRNNSRVSHPLLMYADGFVLLGEPEPRVIRWTDVVSASVVLLRSEDDGTSLESCTVNDRNGDHVTVARAVIAYPSEQVHVVVRKAEQVLTPSVVPALIRAFDAGERLGFGDVSIDLHGITGPNGTFAWQDIQVIFLDARVRLEVKTPDRRRTYAIDMAAAPNAFLAYHVIERAAARADIRLGYTNDGVLPPRLPTPG